MKLRQKNWGLGKIIFDARRNKTDYSVHIDITKDTDFNKNIIVRENDSGRIIKLDFRADGIYLVDNRSH